VTIVSGLPRSGTSMLMQMLAAGGMPVLCDQLRTPDEDNPRGYFEFEPVKRTRKDNQWVVGAVGKAVKLVHLLLPHLPGGYNYRVVFMHRDVHEVLASQQLMLQRSGRRGTDLPPERLVEVFADQVRRVLDWAARQSHVAVLRVDYREVIDDPAVQAKRINTFLGGTLDEAMMAGAVDRSLYRRRRDETHSS
jgi:hypothetical protein